MLLSVVKIWSAGEKCGGLWVDGTARATNLTMVSPRRKTSSLRTHGVDIWVSPPTENYNTGVVLILRLVHVGFSF